MKSTGIIGAMDSEISRLLAAMEGRQTVIVGQTTYHVGRLEDHPVVVARCGIGKVAAGLCVQTMVDRFDVGCVINTGVAGGLDPALSVGDLVLCTEAVQHDFDVSPLGYVRGNLCDNRTPDQPTKMAADPALRALFRAAAAALPTDVQVLDGVIASGDQFVSRAEQRRELRETFGASAAEMEGAAIAQAAVLNGIPFMIVRAISDLADGGAPVSFDQFEALAAERCAQLTMAAVARMA